MCKVVCAVSAVLCAVVVLCAVSAAVCPVSAAVRAVVVLYGVSAAVCEVSAVVWSKCCGVYSLLQLLSRSTMRGACQHH